MDGRMVASVRQCLARLRGARILVVEDDPDTREMIAELSRQEGAVIFEAASGAQGFDLFSRERPDVVVSDLWMPGGDGYEMIRRIRALSPERGGLTPAIAISASENMRSALLAGFHSFAGKPFEIESLFEVIEDFTNGDDRAQSIAPWTIRELRRGLLILTLVGHVRAADMRRMVGALRPHLDHAACRIIVDFRALRSFAPSAASVTEQSLWDRRQQILHVRLVGGSILARLVSTAACAILGIPCSVTESIGET
jgi:CheY-like chemotaxis protein